MGRGDWTHDGSRFGALLIVFLATETVHAAEVKLDLTAGQEPQRVTISAETLVDAKLSLEVTGVPRSSAIELYAAGASVAERRKKACRVPLTAGAGTVEYSSATASCRPLFDRADRSVEYAVSQVGSSDFALLEIAVPPGHSNSKAKLEVQREDEGLGLHWNDWIVPKVVMRAPGAGRFHFFAKTWREAPLGPGGELQFSAADRTFLEHQLAPGGGRSSVEIYLSVVDPTVGVDPVVRSFVVEVVDPPKPKLIVKPFTTLLEECVASVERDRKANEAPVGTHYIVCADLREPERTPWFMTILRASEAKETEAVDRDLYVNRELVAYFFHAQGSKISAAFGANDHGWASSTYVPPELPSLSRDKSLRAELADAPPAERDFVESRRAFLPLLAGPRTMTVEVTTGSGTDATKVPVSHRYRVGRIFNGAVRVGLGVLWSPWERTLDLRDGPVAGGGKRVTVVDGDGRPPGIFTPELTLGYTRFAEPRLELEQAFGVGGYIGASVVEWGSKAKVLTAVLVGVEIAFGHYASLTVVGGLRRIDKPKSELAVGKAPPNGVTTIETTFGITPTLGIVINVPPSVFSALGTVVGYSSTGQ